MAPRLPTGWDYVLPAILTILLPGIVALTVIALALLPPPAVGPSCAPTLHHPKRSEPDHDRIAAPRAH